LEVVAHRTILGLADLSTLFVASTPLASLGYASGKSTSFLVSRARLGLRIAWFQPVLSLFLIFLYGHANILSTMTEPEDLEEDLFADL
jgi:hypothetical protein